MKRNGILMAILLLSFFVFACSSEETPGPGGGDGDNMQPDPQTPQTLQTPQTPQTPTFSGSCNADAVNLCWEMFGAMTPVDTTYCGGAPFTGSATLRCSSTAQNVRAGRCTLTSASRYDAAYMDWHDKPGNTADYSTKCTDTVANRGHQGTWTADADI